VTTTIEIDPNGDDAWPSLVDLRVALAYFEVADELRERAERHQGNARVALNAAAGHAHIRGRVQLGPELGDPAVAATSETIRRWIEES
jgi:hypothetical protein